MTVPPKSDEEIDFTNGIWAAGNGRTNKVHFYATKEDYDAGRCLCGRTVQPHIPFKRWNPDVQVAKENSCPACLSRIGWLKFK